MTTLSVAPARVRVRARRGPVVAAPRRSVGVRPLTAGALAGTGPVTVSCGGSRPAPAPSGRRRTAGGELRLTRRGRLLVTMTFLMAVLLALTVVAAGSTATDTRGADVPTRTVVVAEGDTLWDLAADVAEPGRTREVVHSIMKLNALSSPALVEGQEIAVPVG